MTTTIANIKLDEQQRQLLLELLEDRLFASHRKQTTYWRKDDVLRIKSYIRQLQQIIKLIN